jgi:hypothetical protein
MLQMLLNGVTLRAAPGSDGKAFIANFDRFAWRQNQQIARAVNPNFGAHDVEHGIAN